MVAVVAGFGNGVLRPSLTSLVTHQAGQHEQGVVLGHYPVAVVAGGDRRTSRRRPADRTPDAHPLGLGVGAMAAVGLFVWSMTPRVEQVRGA